MTKVDLITGFLGAGKTTFIKKYAQYFLAQGQKIGILANDFGAVNADVMLLGELEGDNCLIEAVAGACDKDCHIRRFKTKLIAMGMMGLDRVIIEPSGVFDTDEFFDVLHEEPLDRWYEIGSVITIVDAQLDEELSDAADYLLASQCVRAGVILLSKVQCSAPQEIDSVLTHIEKAVCALDCRRERIPAVIQKDWSSFSDEDFAAIAESGCISADYVKRYNDYEGFSTLYYMHSGISLNQAGALAQSLLQDESYGRVYRIKGFLQEGNTWYELNITGKNTSVRETDNGQDIIIVIGEGLQKSRIDHCFTQK